MRLITKIEFLTCTKMGQVLHCIWEYVEKQWYCSGVNELQLLLH
jgi:hypothetical protein